MLIVMNGPCSFSEKAHETGLQHERGVEEHVRLLGAVKQQPACTPGI